MRAFHRLNWFGIYYDDLDVSFNRPAVDNAHGQDAGRVTAVSPDCALPGRFWSKHAQGHVWFKNAPDQRCPKLSFYFF